MIFLRYEARGSRALVWHPTIEHIIHMMSLVNPRTGKEKLDGMDVECGVMDNARWHAARWGYFIGCIICVI